METGATEEQIGAAINRRRARDLGYADAAIRVIACEQWASALVPPDHRIVPVADLNRLMLGYGSCGEPLAEADAFLARVRALIGGA